MYFIPLQPGDLRAVLELKIGALVAPKHPWINLCTQKRKKLYIRYIFFLANKSKVYYGLPKEPEITIPLEDEEDVPESEEKPKVSQGNAT